MSWVSQNKQRYKLNVYDPMILEVSFVFENYKCFNEIDLLF